MKKICRIISILVIIAILIAEIFLRIFYYEQLKIRQTDTNRLPDSLKVFNRKPNVQQTYFTPGVNNCFKSNNMGYVGPDFSGNKLPGVFRIAIIGNSDVVGMQMNSTNNFSVVLQRIFLENHMKIEVINCGREGGAKDIQNMHIIKNEIVKYQPDIVLLEIVDKLEYKRYVYEGYGNYTLNYDPLKPETRLECIKTVDNINKNKWLTGLYDLSYIVRAICKKYVDNHSNWDYKKICRRNSNLEKYLYTFIKKDSEVDMPTYSLTWDYALTELEKVKSSLDSINAKLVLFTYENYSNDIEIFFKNNNINYIQLNINNYNYLPLNSKLEGHTNEIGHALIAQSLFNQLILNNYIPNKIQQNGTDTQ